MDLNEYIRSLKRTYEKPNFFGRPTKNVRIVTNGGGKFVRVCFFADGRYTIIAFVDRTTGDIYSPLSWRQRGRLIGNIRSKEGVASGR